MNIASMQNYTMLARHIDNSGKRTTLALEKAYWQLIDSQAQAAGRTWQGWASEALKGRPADVGKARWLRVKLLDR